MFLFIMLRSCWEIITMSSENVSFTTEQIREKIRADCKIIRDSNRSKKNDCLRIGLGEIQIRSSTFDYIVVKDVIHLCSKIKNQKHITVDDFTNLNKAFLQAADNSIAFVATPGALQIVVKELTGWYIYLLYMYNIMHNISYVFRKRFGATNSSLCCTLQFIAFGRICM